MKNKLNHPPRISLFVLLTSAMPFVSDVCCGQATNRSFSATQAATFVTGPTAVLNGMATANGQPTSAWFQWGINSSYGSQTALSSVGSGAGVVAVTNLVTGLALGRVYHFRLVTSNSLGVAYGADQVFAVGNSIRAWGDDGNGQTEVPAGLVNVVGIAGGGIHSLALRSDGTVAAWGGNGQGQINVPAGLSNVVAIAGGTYHSLALQGGGTVTAWGGNDNGQTNVPVGLSNVVAIAGGGLHSLALRSEGTVAAWGDNTYGQANVPVGLSNVVAIAGGNLYSLALRNDGTVAAWGINSYGQTNVPAGLSHVVGIAGGFQYSLALLSNSTVVTWGQSYNGLQTNLITVPAGLSNVVSISRGGWHSLALKSDGTVTSWGYYFDGSEYVPMTAPAGLNEVMGIGQGALHSLALTISNPPPTSGTCTSTPWGGVAWWTGDGTPNDRYGTYPGSLSNGAAYATGLVGQCFAFDGINDFVSVSNAPDLNFHDNTPMTIELWAYRTGAATGQNIIGKRIGCDGANIQYQMSFSSYNNEGLVFGANLPFVQTHVELPMNQWTHLAGTFDGTTLRFYINGNLMASQVAPLGPTNNGALRIGQVGDCVGFGGLLDEIGIYNRALTLSEIQAIYAAGSAGRCKSPVFTSITKQVDGSVQLDFRGVTAQNISILYSQDLTNWSLLSILPSIYGTNRFIDPASPAVTEKFYRLSQ